MKKALYILPAIFGCAVACVIGVTGCGNEEPPAPPAAVSQGEGTTPDEPLPPPVEEGTVQALPPSADPAAPDWQRLHLPLVIWDHWDALVSTLVLTLDGARVEVPVEHWLQLQGDAPGPESAAAAVVSAVTRRDQDALLALVRPPEGEAGLPDVDGFWEALSQQYGGYAKQTVVMRFRLGTAEGFSVLLEEPEDEGRDAVQVFSLPLLQDESGAWRLATDVLRDARWGAVSAIVYEEFKNPDMQVPVLTDAEAQREHQIDFSHLWGDRENLHPVSISFNGGVPGPDAPLYTELARQMGEIWAMFRRVQGDFALDDPAFTEFLTHLSQGSADYMREYLETEENRVISFWQSHRPAADEVRFVIDAGPLYILFYPTMRGGPKDTFEFLRCRLAGDQVVLTNIGNDDYLSGIFLIPAFKARFAGIIRGMESDRDEKARDAAAVSEENEADPAADATGATTSSTETVQAGGGSGT